MGWKKQKWQGSSGDDGGGDDNDDWKWWVVEGRVGESNNYATTA